MPDAPASVADQAWSALYVDEPLRELITTALQQNYDLRIAAARILQAQAQAGITRADQFPTADATCGEIAALLDADIGLWGRVAPRLPSRLQRCSLRSPADKEGPAGI